MNKKRANLLLELIKIRISIPVAFLAFSGFLLSGQSFNWQALLLAFAVLILAGSASAFNQILEISYDQKMDRTSNRPLPSGQISMKEAIVVSCVLAISGLLLLLWFNQLALLLGLVTFFWYIGVYTLLKRVSAFAVIPGSLTGALPPLIGWAAAGANIFEPYILSLAIFIFILQIPHFWLLMLKYGNDYQKAGFPTLTELFTENQLRKWTFVWTLFALGFSVIFLFWFPSKIYMLLHILAILFVVYLSFRALIIQPSARNFKTLFHTINLLMVFLLILQLIFQ